MSEYKLQLLFAQHGINFNKIRGQFDDLQLTLNTGKTFQDLHKVGLTDVLWGISCLFRIYTENEDGYMDRQAYDDLVYQHLGGENYGNTF